MKNFFLVSQRCMFAHGVKPVKQIHDSKGLIIQSGGERGANSVLISIATGLIVNITLNY